jgi:hypothetical protein
MVLDLICRSDARNGERIVLERSARRSQGRKELELKERIMKISNAEVRPNNLWWPLLAAVLAAAGIVVLLMEPFQEASGKNAAVTYFRGILHVTIPYHAVHSGDGTLKVEVLDPDDKVLGHAERPTAIGEGYGRWQENIRLDKALSVDDLVWHRIRYRYEYNDGKAAAL